MNQGVTHAKDTFIFQPIHPLAGPGAILTEPDNITIMGQWHDHGPHQYPWKLVGPETPCVPQAETPGTDMPGGDYRTFVPNPGTSLTCQTECCGESNCVGYVFALSPAKIGSCATGQPCCYLKASAHSKVPSTVPNITS